MKNTIKEKKKQLTQIVRTCHVCGHIHTSYEEVQRCESCEKSFLPLNYFTKVHAKNTTEFEALFLTSDQLHEDDLIKGLFVLW